MTNYKNTIKRGCLSSTLSTYTLWTLDILFTTKIKTGEPSTLLSFCSLLFPLPIEGESKGDFYFTHTFMVLPSCVRMMFSPCCI